jgi:hypothetical protein
MIAQQEQEMLTRRHGPAHLLIVTAFIVSLAIVPAELKAATSQNFAVDPYSLQIREQIEKLNSSQANVRAAAAEALGFLRAYRAADALAESLNDNSAKVRREAAMSLAWCGAQKHIGFLLDILDDEDWVVRQAAWVALNNLTGMQFPYDALAAPDERAEQITRWRGWWSSVSEGRAPMDVIHLAASDDPESQLRAVRALGAFGGEDAAEMLLKLIEPYRGTVYESIRPIERTMIQATMRSLARLREPRALPILIEFLNGAGWARYAADALGLYGDPAAIGPLVNAYPRFAKNLFRELAQVFPADDLAKLGWDPQDRMYETPYAIMVAISRLPLDDPENLGAVSSIVPLIVANIPSDWDGGLLYEQEAHQLVRAYLLERTGFRRAAIEAAFVAAANLDGIQSYYADRKTARVQSGYSANNQ